VGYIDADVDDPNPNAVAPLTPELTASLSPELTIPVGGGDVTARVDWSFRDDMYGEPSKDPARFTLIDSRDLFNFDISYPAHRRRLDRRRVRSQCHGRAL
jgi:iron complex outermembrane receptor protein